MTDDATPPGDWPRLAFEHGADACAVFDPSGRIARANREFVALTGVEQGDGFGLLDLVAEAERSTVRDVMDAPDPEGRFRLEADITTRGGERLSVEAAGRWLETGTMVLNLRDVTERRRIDQMKNEFISVVNHELRTPLTSIGGALGLLLGGAAGPLDERGRTLVDLAQRNCDRLGRLINDMLDAQKLEAGQFEYRVRLLDLVVALQEATESASLFAQRFGVDLRLDIRVAAANVDVDPDRVAQVLANLLSNAIKYSPRGRSVDVTLAEVQEGYRLEVSDRGKGIPDAFRARMFNKFAQADSSTTRREGGTGLGLAISKAIVEGMGGAIGFDDRPGGGTTFHVTLPASVGAPASRRST